MNLENLCIMLTMFNDQYTVVDHGRTAAALRHIDKGQDERDLVNRIAAKYGIGPIFVSIRAIYADCDTTALQ